MKISTSSVVWKGNLVKGKGTISLGSGAFEGPYSFSSRFENGDGTNPEELIGAAHAGCFSMFLSSLLSKDGHEPTSIHTTAKVHLGDGPKITLIELDTEGVVEGIDEATFIEYAKKAEEGCPISQALSAVKMTLNAKLV